MIDGFRVDVTSDDMIAHLDARVAYHHERAQECDVKLRQLEALEPGPGEEEAFEMCATSRAHGLERMAVRHRTREVFLIFARNHIVAGEIYRLSDADLRLLEWLPVEEPALMMARF